MLKVLLAVVLGCTAVLAENWLELLKQRKTHSQFASLIESTEGEHKYYLNGHVSVFAPSDAAMDAFTGAQNKALILNHIATAFPHEHLQAVNGAMDDSRFEAEERLTSLLQGHPPLWIRRKESDLYVNQAKVSMVLKPISGETKQFLYLIDSVLEPVIPKEENNIADYVDIKSGDLLNNTEKYTIGDFSIKKYAEQLAHLGLEKFPEYAAYGKSTFFIPVDQAFEGMDKRLVDEEVVRSHIVPGNVLFTQPNNKLDQDSKLYNTLQYKQASMEVKVVVSMFDGDDGEIKVQSQTITGNKNHARGKVIANIVKGNLPVQNGVVHLIDRPLVILTNSLWEMLDPTKKENKRFSKFANLVIQHQPLLDMIQNAESSDEDDTKNGATLFVPTNTAFEALLEGGLSEELVYRPDLFGFHYLDSTVESNDIRIIEPQNSWGMFGATVGFPEGTKNKNWIWSSGSEVMVEGGGVQATVVDGDIRATNGIIHQIDKVLGVPLDTVLDKLKNDPMLKQTYQLGEQEHFNEKLGNTELNFTYLIPMDQAWMDVKNMYSSAYKVLFLGTFFYQAHHALERHLKVGESLSLEQMIAAGELDTIRGAPLKITTDTVDGEEVTVIKHEDIKSRVVRGNLRCSNGYVHIIDRVIMKRRDVTLSGCLMNLPSAVPVALALLLSMLVK